MVAFLQRTLLACLFLLALAVPSFGQTPVYNEYEVGKLKEFMEQKTILTDRKNGELFNEKYNPDDPTTYGTITWSNSAVDKRVETLSLVYYTYLPSQGGAILDVSNFTKLTSLTVSCYLQSVDFTGCLLLNSVDLSSWGVKKVKFNSISLLKKFRLSRAEIESLDLSVFPNLESISISDIKVSALNIKGCSKLRFLKLTKLGLKNIDLSSYPNLIGIDVSDNELTSIDISSNLILSDIKCDGNKFKLSSLPIREIVFKKYAPQNDWIIGKDFTINGNVFKFIEVNELIDLSSEAYIGGKPSVYIWKQSSDGSVVVPTSSKNGIFSFGSSFSGKSLYCEISNPIFPEFIDNNIFKTASVVVGTSFNMFNTEEAEKIRRYLDSPSQDPNRCNGFVLNPNYKSDDPSTYFGVTWGNYASDKRVKKIEWYNENLSSTLDISGLSSLESVSIRYSNSTQVILKGCRVLGYIALLDGKLTSLDLSDCTSLRYVNCQNNNINNLILGSHPNLTDLLISDNPIYNINVSGCSKLSSVYCNNTNLKFSTLPKFSSRIYDYSYYPLKLMPIGRDANINGVNCNVVSIGEVIDLSAEASVSGISTVFIWKDAKTGLIVNPTTITSRCLFTFGSEFAGKILYCEMSNGFFPKLSGELVLKTVNVAIGDNLGRYNSYEVDNLKIFLNKPSGISDKTNGQQISENYNQNDPSTFGVEWSEDFFNKKVLNINWGGKKLSGSLNVSGFSSCTEVYVNWNSLTNVNVTNCSSLIALQVSGNLIKDIDVSTLVNLKYLGIDYNYFKFSTLPKVNSSIRVERVIQRAIPIGESQLIGSTETYVLPVDQIIDFSSEFIVNGVQTTFIWRDPNADVEIQPSKSDNGKFSFNSSFIGKTVYCRLKNSKFSDFDNWTNDLQTVKVLISPAYNQNDVDKLKAFLNKPSAEAGKTNGQQVNGSYKANDPATYGVNWSKHSANKRVVNFQWLTKNLAGGLDLSSCELLTVAWLSDNKLTSLNLKGCTELTDLDARMNELATVSMDSHPKLGSIDLSTNKLTSLSVGGVPNLSMLFLFSNQLTQLDLSKVTSLTRLKVYNNALTSLDVSGLSKLQLLKAEQNKLTSVKFGGNSKLELVNLDGNMLSAVDVVGLPALKDLTVSNNKFNLSKIPSKNTTHTSYIYAPQPPMVVGHATQDGNITKYSIYADEPLDLSSELTIGGITTIFVWKKADGTAVQPTSAAGGVFTFTNSFIGETIYGELTNSSFPDFAADKAYRTVPVTIQSPYNAGEVAALTRFFSKPSAAAGSTNGAQVGITNQNNPQTWNGVVWSNEVSDRRVISISWSGLNISDTLNLTGFSKIGALDVTSNMLNRVVVDQTPLLTSVLLANNRLRFSTMPTIGTYDQYSSFPQSKLVVGTKSADGLGDGYTLLAGELVNLSGEYDVAGQITTFVWKDNTGTAIVPTKSDKGRFSFNREFIGKKLHCELSNSKFPGGILETVEVLIPGSKFEKEFGDEISFILYPNPATSFIKVETTDLIQSYRIFASNGVLQKAGEINDFRSEIDVQGLKPGIYFIELKVGSQAYRSKFIKQ